MVTKLHLISTISGILQNQEAVKTGTILYQFCNNQILGDYNIPYVKGFNKLYVKLTYFLAMIQ